MRGDDRHLPQGWHTAAIADLSRFVTSGSRGWAQYHAHDGALFLRVGNLAGDRVTIDLRNAQRVRPPLGAEGERTKTQAGDVLLSITADVGRVGLVTTSVGEAYVNQHVALIRPHAHVYAPGLAYALLDPLGQQAEVRGAQYGATKPGLSLDQVRAIRVRLPPAPEHTRIVAAIESHLSRLDEAEAALDRVERNLRRYRASILQAAVEGRLVPTEATLARAEGRDYEPASELLKRILGERRRRWEEAELARLTAAGKRPGDDRWKAKYEEPRSPDASALPPLPEGWCWSSLGELFALEIGATPSRAVPAYWNGDIPWVSSGEVAFCRITSTQERITALGLAQSSTKLNPAGTVLLGMIGEGRTRGQVAVLDVPACNNQNAAAIRVSETGLPPEFVYYYLMGQYNAMRAVGSGNNQPALNKTRVGAIAFPLPPLAEQSRICQAIEAVLSIVDRMAAQAAGGIEHASRLRQAILKWAFEGKLVDQDPNDEPASVLLERIRAERAQVAVAGTSRRPRRGRPSGERRRPTRP